MTTITEGDVFRAVLAGGGGWGDPLDRSPAFVLDDVLNDKVSPQSAREDYGVVINVEAKQVEEGATQELRGQLRGTVAG